MCAVLWIIYLYTAEVLGFLRGCIDKLAGQISIIFFASSGMFKTIRLCSLSIVCRMQDCMSVQYSMFGTGSYAVCVPVC